MTLLLLEGFDTGDWTQRANSTSGSASVNTVTKRTGYGSLRLTGTAPSIQWAVLSSDQHATLVLGAGVNLSATTATQVMRTLSDDGTVRQGVLNRTATGTVQVLRDTVLLGESVTAPLADTGVWHYVEFSYTVGDGTAGAFSVAVDGVVVLSGSGVDTRNGGATGLIDRGHIGRPSGSGPDIYVDDVYMLNGAGSINNSRLGPIAVEALYPNANGNYSQLVGSDGNSTDNYLLVDEAPDPSATDYVGSATDGQKDTYGFADLSVGSATIPGVEVRMWAAKTDTNPKSVRRVHRRGGVDSVGADRALADTYTSYAEVLELDPNGSIAWTVTNLNASEWGAEVRP